MNLTRPHSDSRSTLPVSIVIPVRNENDSVRELVESLHAQMKDSDELIVVETGSADGTSETLEILKRSLPRLKVVEAPGSYPGEARNEGLLVAENPWVALIDAGTRVDPRWLSSLRKAVEERETLGVVFGRFDPVITRPLDRWALLAYVPPILPDRTRGPSTASMIIHKRIWEAVGGFPPFRAGEDLVFFSKLRKMGVEAGVAPGAVVEWFIPGGWGKTWLRVVSYSTHTLLAGLWRNWHLGLARNLTVVLALGLLGSFSHPIFFIGIPALYLARVGWKARKKWDEPSLAGHSRVRLLLGAALLTGFLDAASTWGVLRAALHKGRK